MFLDPPLDLIAPWCALLLILLSSKVLERISRSFSELHTVILFWYTLTSVQVILLRNIPLIIFSWLAAFIDISLFNSFYMVFCVDIFIGPSWMA